MFDNTKVKFIHYPKELIYLCKRNSNTYTAPIEIGVKDGTKIIAHRGLSGVYQENTLAAFNAAGKFDYFGIETDVHRTADGAYVIIHDDNAKRVSGVDAVIENTDLDTLKAINLYPKNGVTSADGTKIPMLADYVSACKASGKIGVLELKNHFEESDVDAILDIIKNLGYTEGIIFISFDFDNCIAVRKRLPTAPVQYLTAQYDESLLEKLSANKLDVDIYGYELNKKRIDAFHEENILVNCWTVDSPCFAKKLIRWGVDFITTNILL